VVSEIAIVPESECNTPTFIASLACAIAAPSVSAATPAILENLRIILLILLSVLFSCICNGYANEIKRPIFVFLCPYIYFFAP
jgi:hypothetical protein